MRKLILALVIALFPTLAMAQCNGVFAPHTACGNGTNNPAIPGQVVITALGANTFANIAALRANTQAFPTVYVQGYTTVADGGEGVFNYVASDTTTTDNNCTIFVDASGHRYYRPLQLDLSVKWCGAKGNSSTDDTTAIQGAINTAKAYTNGALCVIFPPGNYVISSLNATHWTGGCMRGAPGSQGSVIYAANQVSPAPILDITSSPGTYFANLLFFGTTAGGAAPAVFPNVGVLIAAGPGLSDTDLIRFDFVQFAGFFSTAACYVYSVSDLRFDSVNCVNDNTSVGYGFVAGGVNVFSVTSPYTTIGTGTGVSGDLTWYGGSGGIGELAPSQSTILLVGVQGYRFRDGVIGAGATSHFIQIQGTCSSCTFESIELNTTSGTLPTDLFFFSGATITGMFIANLQSGGQYSGNMLNGGSSTITGGAIVGMVPASITGPFAASFSHLP
jgi:hypothetical protein